jgi:predicted alpha/beta-fold hydrolase
VSLSGHLWTLSGFVARAWRPVAAPVSRPWTTVVEDADLGAVRLSGALSALPGARGLVVIVHGLGGCCDSPYVVAAAARLVDAGYSCLRLNLRGADRTGEDIYHAGLTDDLEAALASDEIRSSTCVAVLGFSLGGHVSLRLAVASPPPNLRAVVAVCPPLDLAATAMTIDAPSRWLYRRYLLERLCDIYDEVAARRRLARSVAEVRRARTFVEFDTLVIAPRYGFADAWDYYETVSVGKALHRIEIPTLILAAEGDPMVPVAGLEAAAAVPGGRLLVHRAARGGHLAFPRQLDLGAATRRGLHPQLLGWLGAQMRI